MNRRERIAGCKGKQFSEVFTLFNDDRLNGLLNKKRRQKDSRKYLTEAVHNPCWRDSTDTIVVCCRKTEMQKTRTVFSFK